MIHTSIQWRGLSNEDWTRQHRREVAWIDEWMDDYLTSGLEILKRSSQGCRSRFGFPRRSLCDFWYASLKFPCYLGCLKWAWEIEVSFTDGVLTCGLARFSWACFDVPCFLMRGSERSKCLFGKGHLRSRWHKIDMASWHHWHQIWMKSWPYDDTTMISSARSPIRMKIGFLCEGRITCEREFLQLVALVSRWSFAKARTRRGDAARWASQESTGVVRTRRQVNRHWSPCYAHVRTYYHGGDQDDASLAENEGSVGLIRMLVPKLW